MVKSSAQSLFSGGPKSRESGPPMASESFPDLEHLDRPELDDVGDEWDSKSAVLRKSTGDVSDVGDDAESDIEAPARKSSA